MQEKSKYFRRVVITGMAPLTGIGIGVDTFWEQIVAGSSGVVANDLFDCSAISSRVVAPVRSFDPCDYMNPKLIRRTSRFMHFAIAATQIAMADADLPLEEHTERRGVFLGTAFGSVGTIVSGCRTIHDQGMGRVSAFSIQMMLSNVAVGHVALMIGAHGQTDCWTTACAAATNAIGGGFTSIQRGLVDLAVAGGAEAALEPIVVAGLSNMYATSRRNDEPTKASRPFDRDRDGFVPAEGAGILILEELECARRRSARIYAEIVGYGNSNDAYDPVQPSPNGVGAASAIARAIDDAGVAPIDIDYINAHATGTDAGDTAENEAIKSVFGEDTIVPISATKSMTGHLMGASGAIQAIATAKSLETGILPPTINLDNLDDGFDLNYISNTAMERPISCAISNSFGFGGQNACLILSKYVE